MLRSTVPLLLAALLLPPVSAFAQTLPPAPQKSVYLETETVDIHLIATTLEHYNNVKILIVNGDKPYRLVSVHLVKSSIHAALEAIAASAGAKVTQDTAGVYVFTPDASVLNTFSQRLQSQQVQLTTFFAGLPPVQNQTVDLAHPEKALLQMYEAGAVFSPREQITTGPSAPAAISLRWHTLSERRSLSIHLVRTNPEAAPVLLHITPRINSDQSVTLSLDFNQPLAPGMGAANMPVTTPIPIVSARTAHGGAMTVFEVTGAYPSAYRVFLFVTPTLVSASTDVGAIKANP